MIDTLKMFSSLMNVISSLNYENEEGQNTTAMVSDMPGAIIPFSFLMSSNTSPSSSTSSF